MSPRRGQNRAPRSDNGACWWRRKRAPLTGHKMIGEPRACSVIPVRAVCSNIFYFFVVFSTFSKKFERHAHIIVRLL